MTARIVYPVGGGGNWLDDVIWHLEHANFEPTAPNIVFDHGRDSSIRFEHALYLEQQLQHRESFARRALVQQRTIVFATKCVFNIFVNYANKFLYLRKKLADATDQEHVFTLSNAAKWFMTDGEFQSTYCGSVDLDYALLVLNPEAFVDQLFAVLDSIDFKYTANRQYVLDSIENYMSTCENVNNVYGNTNSWLWLGFCHAIVLIDQLDIAVIEPDSTIESIAKILQPHYEYCKNRIDPMIAKWKK